MQYEIITFVAADVGKKLHAGVEKEAVAVRSAPPYTGMLPKYREIAHDIVSVQDKKVFTKTKFYDPDVVIVEAHAFVDDIFSKDILEFKKAMLNVCVGVAQKRDHFAEIYEEYTIFCIAGYRDLSSFDKHKPHIVGLMRNEVEEMDKAVVDSALSESSIKYSSNDLVVVGWDSAVLFSDDSKEFPEIVEVLVVGNIQLLKIRLLNKELEDGLQSLNKLLSTKKFIWFKLRKILRHIVELRTTSIFELEHTKTNINLLGDWYNATLYSLAAKKFHLDEKMNEVNKRLDALEDVYEMLSMRLDNSYLLIMELLIVLLIVLELAVAFI